MICSTPTRAMCSSAKLDQEQSGGRADRRLGRTTDKGRSVAVDPANVPLGAPVFLSTTRPNSSAPLRRLMLAQDTGGAIRGVVRADFFWGLCAPSLLLRRTNQVSN